MKRIASTTLLMLVLSAPLAQARQEVRAGSLRPGHALLVGVGDYPRLRYGVSEAHYRAHIKLHGPPRDVERMQAALVDSLEFEPEKIHVLSQGGEGSRPVPTRDAIERAFVDLARRSEAGELVVVFLAGHGSRVPDRDGDEADGRDEVFLPADTQRWDAESGTVRGAITDDEIGEWIDRITATGARVWLIVDACHSGTLLRGATDTRSRHLSSDALGIPADELVAPATREASPHPLLDDGRGDVVAMYAAAAHEKAIERRMPGVDGEPHGVFTWLLTERLVLTGGATTFARLLEDVRVGYRAHGIHRSSPQTSGPIQAPILADARPTRGLFLGLGEGRDELTVDGGLLHQLSEGAILRVFQRDRRGDEEHVVGRVRVVDCGLVSSRVLPLDGRPIPELREGVQLPAEACIGSFEAGLLKVALLDDAGSPVALGAIRPELRERLERDRSYGVRFVLSEPDEAELFLERHESGGRLIPSRPGTISGAEFTGDGLFAAIHRIYRANGLRRIALDPGAGVLPSGFEFRIEREVEGPRPWPALGSGAVVTPGTRAQLVLVNEAERARYAYVYFLDARLRSSRIFPEKQGVAAARVPAGSRIEIGQPQPFNDRTLGVEEFVCIVSDEPMEWIWRVMWPSETPDGAERRGATRGGEESRVGEFIEDLTRGVVGSDRTRSGGDVGAGRAWVEVVPIEVRWPDAPGALPTGVAFDDGATAVQLLDARGRAALRGEGVTLPEAPYAGASVFVTSAAGRGTVVRSVDDGGGRWMMFSFEREPSGDRPHPGIRAAGNPAAPDIALRFTRTDRTALYDTDRDGRANVVLIDTDRDGLTDLEFGIGAEGEWFVERGGATPWLQVARCFARGDPGYVGAMRTVGLAFGTE